MQATTTEAWRARRDAKLLTMLDPDEPAWLVEEAVDLPADKVTYTIVHRWKPGGWARRHYLYDTFADVIHFRGSTPVSDDALTKLKPEQRIGR